MRVIFLFIYLFFFPFPLASSRNACVGLLISKVLQSGETHFSSGPASAGSSPPWEAGRVLSRGWGSSPSPGGPCPHPRVFPCCPQVSDGSLTVLSVSREDRGAYTCRAYSIQGEAVHTTRLLVQGEIFHPSPSGLSLAAGIPGGAGRGLRGWTSMDRRAPK